MFQLNTTSVFVDPNMFTVMDFDGLSTTGPVCHVNVNLAPGIVGASAIARAAPLNPAQVIATAAVAANAANQALIAN